MKEAVQLELEQVSCKMTSGPLHLLLLLPETLLVPSPLSGHCSNVFTSERPTLTICQEQSLSPSLQHLIRLHVVCKIVCFFY